MKANAAMMKQGGSTLLLALLMMLVITMLGVSSMRQTSQEILIASNAQQLMFVEQANATVTSEVATFYSLSQWLNDESQPANKVISQDWGDINSSSLITQGKNYYCLGNRGRANSIGVGKPKCRAFTFDVVSQLVGTGAKSGSATSVGVMLP